MPTWHGFSQLYINGGGRLHVTNSHSRPKKEITNYGYGSATCTNDKGIILKQFEHTKWPLSTAPSVSILGVCILQKSTEKPTIWTDFLSLQSKWRSMTTTNRQCNGCLFIR